MRLVKQEVIDPYYNVIKNDIYGEDVKDAACEAILLIGDALDSHILSPISDDDIKKRVKNYLE